MLFPTDIYERMIAAKMFMDANFHEPLQFEQIAKQAFLSPYHFHRLFCNIYKRTPHQYLTGLRMQKAKMLLEKEGISVAEICGNVGFESISSFSPLFKKQSGQAPQYYRNIAYLKNSWRKNSPKDSFHIALLRRTCLIENSNF